MLTAVAANAKIFLFESSQKHFIYILKSMITANQLTYDIITIIIR